jgi:hypothetical protein
VVQPFQNRALFGGHGFILPRRFCFSNAFPLPISDL